MKILRLFVLVIALGGILMPQPSSAASDDYDDSQSHPLRVVAYLVHPVGVLAEWIIFRPLHFLVSAAPATEYVFGHKPHPPILAEPQPYYHYGVQKRVPLQDAQATNKSASEKVTVVEVPVEKVIVKEVPVEKIVIKEVPKIVEVEKLVFPDLAFRFNSADLTEVGKGTVYLAAQKLQEKSDVTVVLEGHTDFIGSEEYNRRLGLRRAQTVMAELKALGIDPARMSASTMGESKPLVDQPTDWARAVNRRVEFQVKAR